MNPKFSLLYLSISCFKLFQLLFLTILILYRKFPIILFNHFWKYFFILFLLDNNNSMLNDAIQTIMHYVIMLDYQKVGGKTVFLLVNCFFPCFFLSNFFQPLFEFLTSIKIITIENSHPLLWKSLSIYHNFVD